MGVIVEGRETLARGGRSVKGTLLGGGHGKTITGSTELSDSSLRVRGVLSSESRNEACLSVCIQGDSRKGIELPERKFGVGFPRDRGGERNKILWILFLSRRVAPLSNS